tara:strand:- start:16614 stop:17798 length:1185 start_codon:yes stop_codon:yes gene_type:complete
MKLNLSDKAKFIPVMIPVNGGDGYKAKEIKDKYDITWWTKNSMFYYPYVLVSYPNVCNIKGSMRKFFRIPDDMCVIGDSGGFQLMSNKLYKGIDISDSINPLKVLRWQEENCNLGMGLDFPPYSMWYRDYKKCMDISEENHRMMVSKRNSKKLKLYKVFQMYGLEFKWADEWWKMIDKLDGFDGIAASFKGKSHNPLYMASVLMYLYDKGVRSNLHIFGISGITYSAMFYYLSNFITNLTFDSSSYVRGQSMRVYFLPNTFKYSTPLCGGESFKNNPNIQELPCDCSVCVNNDINMFKEKGSKAGSLLSLHNLHITIKQFDMLDKLRKDKVFYKEFVKANMHPIVWESLNFIDMVVEKGFKYAFEKYAHKIGSVKDGGQQNKVGESKTNKLLDY